MKRIPKTPMPTVETDLIGKKFGRYLVLSYWGMKQHFHYWLCRCECGTEREVCGWRLITGQTQSCGCLRIDKLRERTTTHGECSNYTESPEYRSYQAAMRRCNNPKHISYKYYGGRGIKFRFTSFGQFFAEVGRKPTPKHTIDRKNVNGDYEPGNIRWATYSEQRLNKRPTA